MTFEQLITLYNAYVGNDGDVDNADLAQWFNEAQKDLAYDFANAGSFAYEDVVTAGRGVNLPNDCIKLIDADQPYYMNAAAQIVFEYGGHPTVAYRKMPDMFTGDGDQECQLPVMVHDIIALWAAYRYWLREAEGDGEEMNQAMRFYQDYQTAKAIAKVKIDNASNSKIDRWVIE